MCIFDILYSCPAPPFIKHLKNVQPSVLQDSLSPFIQHLSYHFFQYYLICTTKNRSLKVNDLGYTVHSMNRTNVNTHHCFLWPCFLWPCAGLSNTTAIPFNSKSFAHCSLIHSKLQDNHSC